MNNLLLLLAFLFSACGNDGLNNSQVLLEREASYLALEKLDLAPMSANKKATRFIILKNTSSHAASEINLIGLKSPLSFEGGAFPGKSSDCPKDGTLGAGASCRISLEIAAQNKPASIEQNLNIKYLLNKQQIQSKKYLLKINIIKEVKELHVGDLDFGQVKIGDKKTDYLVISNNSSYDVSNIFIKRNNLSSKFIIKDEDIRNSCGNLIKANNECKIRIEFDANAKGLFSEELEITYDLDGSKTIKPKLSGRAVEQILLEVKSTFPVVYRKLSSSGTLTLKNSGPQDISNLNIGGLTGEFSINGSFPGILGTCSADGRLKAGDECDVDIQIKGQDKLGKISEKINLSYDMGGKKFTDDFELAVDIKDLKQLHARALNLGTPEMEKGSRTREIVLTNSSHIDRISNLVIKPPANSQFVIVDPNNCRNINVDDKCLFFVTFDPEKIIAFPATGLIQEVFDISYDIGAGADKESKKAKVDVKVAPRPVPADLQITGNFNFGNQIINTIGDAINIKLKLDNPINGKKVKLGDLAGSWSGELKLENSSTCAKNLVLQPGDNCAYNINIIPQNSDNNYKKNFNLNYERFQYKTGDGTEKYIPKKIVFDVSGGIVIKAAASATQIPQFIKAKADPTDPYWPYIKRPLISSTTAKNTYSAADLARIPADSWSGMYGKNTWMPWAFSTAWNTNNVPVKLKDIVPDRIIDPATGERYIKLYHGSTVNFKDTFMKGRDAVGFGVATTTAFGKGFYLAANPNESKRYACNHMFGNNGMLLVVGIKEDDKVVGKASHRDLSNRLGEPLENDIMFRLGQNNQFVFFTNSLPYMKIFEVIELPKGFGAANSIIENDGHSTESDTPDINNSFKCL